jgi:ferredoxin
MQKKMLFFAAAICMLAACKKDASTVVENDINSPAQIEARVAAATQKVTEVSKELNLTTPVTEKLVTRIMRTYGSAENWKATILANRKRFEEYRKQHPANLRSSGDEYEIRLKNDLEGLDDYFYCSPSSFILDVAAENGFSLPQCDGAGGSAACACRVQGNADIYTSQSNATFLSDCDRASGFVLPCVAFPMANMTLYTHQEDVLIDNLCITGIGGGGSGWPIIINPPYGGGGVDPFNGGGGYTGGGGGYTGGGGIDPFNGGGVDPYNGGGGVDPNDINSYYGFQSIAITTAIGEALPDANNPNSPDEINKYYEWTFHESGNILGYQPWKLSSLEKGVLKKSTEPNEKYEFKTVENVYFGKIKGGAGPLIDLGFEKLSHDITLGRFNFGVEGEYELRPSITYPGSGIPLTPGTAKKYNTGQVVFNIDEGTSTKPN